MENSQPLPSPRALLTALLTTLFTSTSPTPPESTPSLDSNINRPNTNHAPDLTSNTHSNPTKNNSMTNPSYATLQEESNPLKALSRSQKALLSTLHVLFPPPMLLLSLDLLDRGLVGRVVYLGEGVKEDEGEDERVSGEENVKRESGREEESRGDSAKGKESADVSIKPALSPSHSPHSNPDLNEKSTSITQTTIPTIPPQVTTDLSPPSPKPQLQSSPNTNLTNPTHPLIKPTDSKPTPKPTIIYQVRSSQTASRSRFTPHAAPINTAASVYTVHLDAWNCSCAAFAFSAFPYTAPTLASGMSSGLREVEGKGTRLKAYSYEKLFSESFSEERDDSGLHLKMGGSEREDADEWEFGGLSATYKNENGDGDGDRDGQSLPICKHLLACLLADRWDVLRGYAKEKICAGREELGGLVVVDS